MIDGNPPRQSPVRCCHRGKVEVVEFKWHQNMYEWIYKATLLFRQSTPDAQHQTKPEILARSSNGECKIRQLPGRVLSCPSS